MQETGFYSFKWRNYMPDVGRFFNVDPLSEKYAYQSHYNFSENRVVDARELEGLEKVLINTALNRDKLFKSAYTANRQTTGGKQFLQKVQTQNKYNVLYAPFWNKYDPSSGREFSVSNQQEYNTTISNYGLKINKSEYNNITDNGTKELIIIGVQLKTNGSRKDVEKEETLNLAATINHEESAHAVFSLDNIEKSNAEGYKSYYGEKKESSPSPRDVLSDKKYERTQAKMNFKELLKVIFK
ncbi:hypothetical protein LO744_11385 [Chryseobacterium sp. C-17]|uniref:RHS repeat-associated core domain-containing protein n=1 Tax=Chryseobacterium turcicum TaxID=2898076 RepID=A0A9Q3YXR9_9FLAO|nr:hypothetical protein [Chryseobacterium turcicum]